MLETTRGTLVPARSCEGFLQPHTERVISRVAPHPFQQSDIFLMLLVPCLWPSGL